MTKIEPINQVYKKPFLTPKNTGYAAAIAILLTSTRAFCNKKTVTKTHKLLGYISGVLTLLHIGTIKYLHHKYKKM